MTVLCYHAVEPGWASPMAVEPRTFAAQVGWLARHRSVVPLHVAAARLDRRGQLPAGMVSLTFDDGFRGLYDHAMPVLDGLPATVFLVAQTLTSRGQGVDWVDDPPTHALDTLDLEQIREMAAAGVSFESHSYSHADLTQLSYADCVRDLRDSRQLLESLLGRPVRMLAYPRGRHNAAVRAAAQRAGYAYAFTLPEGPEEPGPYAVPRVGIYGGNGVGTLRAKSAHPYLRLRTARPLTRTWEVARAVRSAVR
jgi:peptidoglycan/xylan/chitin deacetylase (PgdA/CDA1 family)